MSNTHTFIETLKQRVPAGDPLLFDRELDKLVANYKVLLRDILRFLDEGQANYPPTEQFQVGDILQLNLANYYTDTFCMFHNEWVVVRRVRKYEGVSGRYELAFAYEHDKKVAFLTSLGFYSIGAYFFSSKHFRQGSKRKLNDRKLSRLSLPKIGGRP